MEVGFAESVVAVADRPELEMVLHGLAGPTRWPQEVDRVTIVRRLAEGRSGAEVFAIDVEFKGADRAEQCVVKVDSATAVTAEWTAVRAHVQTRAQVILTPVEAVSAFVLDGSAPGLAMFGRAAIVYRHVAAWAGLPAETPETLESIVASALDRRNSDPAVRLLEGLIRRLGTALHQPAHVVSGLRTQTHLNPSLGEDLVLVVDHVDTGGFPHDDAENADDVTQARRYPMDVLHAATRPPTRPEPGARISVGDLILLEVELAPSRRDNCFAGKTQHTNVVLEPATHQARTALAASVGRRIPVRGRVRTTRAAEHLQTLTRFLPDLDSMGADQATMLGVSVSNPFGPLRAILTTDVAGRVLSTVHGDLNPRNVLVVDQQVYLIDFAMVQSDRPVVSDPAWLEMCLLRDVIADRLDWPALVRLQRLLAAATSLGPVVAEANELGFSAADGPLVRTAFEMLWAIRREAFAAYPPQARARFGRDYLEQLSLAAFRTIKWPDADQDEPKIRAALSACGVAAEWLDGPEPYRHWPQPELDRLVEAGRGRVGSDSGFADLIAEALRTLDRHGEAARSVHEAVDAVRTHVLATTYLPAAEKIVAGRPAGTPYIDLEAYVATQDTAGSAIELVADLPEVVLVSGAGGGKSRLVDQLRLRLARALCRTDHDGPPPRFPALVRAGRIADALGDGSAGPERVLAQVTDLAVRESHLRVGALHLLIDEFGELTGGARERTAAWVRELRRRYPRTPVAVCHRSLGFAPDQFHFPVAELQEVTDGMARRYANDVFLAELGMKGGETADRLFHLLSRPQYRPMAKLVRNPLFLEILVHAYARPEADDGTLPADVGALFGELADRLLGAAGDDTDLASLDRTLEELAVALVERDTTEAPYEESDPIMRALLGTDLLHRENGRVRFGQQPLRDYYAARVLARMDDAGFAERVRQFRWREPLLIMAGFSGGSPKRTAQLLELAEDLDAGFAGQVLRACREAPRNAVERFIARQIATLRANRGERSWKTAARALAELDSPAARSALMSVAESTGAAATARGIALAALVRPTFRAADGRGESHPELVRTLERLLRTDTPESLLRRAVETVGEARLTTLGIAIADLVDSANPWHVVDAAYDTLRRIGITPRERHERVYLEACEARLIAIEEDLQRTAGRGDIARLTSERLAHLERMFGAGRVDLLLDRRFSFGIADDVFWSKWLRPSHLWVARPELAEALGILRGDLDGSDLVRRYAEGDDLTAIAAAHRIIEHHPDLSADLLATVSPRSSPHRLLAAAQVAARSGGHGNRLRSLIREVAEIAEPAGVEALTALVAALPGKPAVLVSASVVNRLGERGRRDLLHGWPWFQLLTDLPFDAGTCTELLLADDDEAAAAAMFWLNVDIAGGALLDAGEARPFRLPDEARSALLARSPAEDRPFAVPTFLGACVKAGAGTPELLRTACTLARRTDVDWPVHVMSSTDYGSVEQSALADLLTRIGFLARHASATGDHEGAVAAHMLLSGLPTQGSHPSVERGRLAGLAVLGDWPPVLTRLPGGDVVMQEVARNAVRNWRHGPAAPGGMRGDADIGRWLAARLEDPDLEPAVRDTLLSISDFVGRSLDR